MRLGFMALLFTPALSQSLTVTIDYSDDLAGRNFFGTNTEARNALEAAAISVSNAITTQLGAIVNDPVVGTNGGTTFSINPSYSYTNPQTGVQSTVNSTLLGADEFRIYVGSRLLDGTTLGQGGPGGAGASAGIDGFESEVVGAVANAEAAFNAEYIRGGPVFSNLSFTGIGAANASADLNFGGTLGNIWFDVDINNDDILDSNTELNSFWHFDHTTAVEAGKIDFYSVALHEMLHTVGFGLIDSWDDLVNGTNWTGAEVIALLGTGTDVLDPGQAHVKAGTMGLSIVDGTPQEAIMDPDITKGVRKQITDVDLAFLQDMGWSVVPEHGHYAAMIGFFACFAMIGLRRRRVS